MKRVNEPPKRSSWRPMTRVASSYSCRKFCGPPAGIATAGLYGRYPGSATWTLSIDVAEDRIYSVGETGPGLSGNSPRSRLNTAFDCVVNRGDQTLVSEATMLWLSIV